MPEPAPMESKICEWGCGRTFLRPIPVNAARGQKGCNACMRMSIEQREQQYEEQQLREAKAKRGVF